MCVCVCVCVCVCGNVGYPQVLLGVGQQQVLSPYYYNYNGNSSQDPMNGGEGGSMSLPGPYFYPYPGLAYLTIAYVPVALYGFFPPPFPPITLPHFACQLPPPTPPPPTEPMTSAPFLLWHDQRVGHHRDLR